MSRELLRSPLVGVVQSAANFLSHDHLLRVAVEGTGRRYVRMRTHRRYVPEKVPEVLAEGADVSGSPEPLAGRMRLFAAG